MKKFGMILLVLMLTNLAYGQGMSMQKNSINTIGKYSVFVKGDTVAAAVYDLNKDRMVVQLDTFRTGDTMKVFYFGNKYMDGFITLYDSLGKGSSDTFYVERYDTMATQSSKAWTQVQVMYVDISTNVYTTSNTGRYGYTGTNVFIPGVGLTKTYYIAEPRPGTYRVWVNSVDLYGNKKKYVKWTGKNR